MVRIQDLIALDVVALAHGSAKARFNKVETRALVRLADVTANHPAVAALTEKEVTRLNAGERPADVAIGKDAKESGPVIRTAHARIGPQHVASWTFLPLSKRRRTPGLSRRTKNTHEEHDHVPSAWCFDNGLLTSRFYGNAVTHKIALS
jgi:hypothetical protein